MSRRGVCDKGNSGKGKAADNMSSCPGTEVRLAFLAIGDSPLELRGTLLKASHSRTTNSMMLVAVLFVLKPKIFKNFTKIFGKRGSVSIGSSKNGNIWAGYSRDPDGTILEAVEGDVE